MTLFDAFIEILRLFLQRHGPPFDKRDAFVNANPNLASLAAFFHQDVADMIIEQPASAVKILPAVPTKCGVRIKARRALVASEPYGAGFFASEGFEVPDRSAFGILPRHAARVGADLGGHLGRINTVMSRGLLGLSEAGASEQHQTDRPKNECSSAHAQRKGGSLVFVLSVRTLSGDAVPCHPGIPARDGERAYLCVANVAASLRPAMEPGILPGGKTPCFPERVGKFASDHFSLRPFRAARMPPSTSGREA